MKVCFANSLLRPRRNGCVNCSSCEQSNGGSDEKDPQNIWIFSNSQCTTCQCHTNKTFLCFCVLRCKVIFISWCHHFFWNVKVKHAKHLPTFCGPGLSFHVVNFEQFPKNLPPHIQHLPMLEKGNYFCYFGSQNLECEHLIEKWTLQRTVVRPRYLIYLS